MTLSDLIEALDQRYGNPYAAKECGLIQEAIKELRKFQEIKKQYVGGLIKEVITKRTEELKNEDCNGK
jgi:hypothetical protein